MLPWLHLLHGTFAALVFSQLAALAELQGAPCRGLPPPAHSLIRGDAAAAPKAVGSMSSPCLQGTGLGQRACPHHLYKVLSLCTSPSFFLMGVGPVPSLPVLRFSSFRQVTSLTLVTYTFKQNLLAPLRQDKS